jgi:hypothetical protein
MKFFKTLVGTISRMPEQVRHHHGTEAIVTAQSSMLSARATFAPCAIIIMTRVNDFGWIQIF